MAGLVEQTYGEAMYALAVEQQADEEIRQTLIGLDRLFAEQPAFYKLLISPLLSLTQKQEMLDRVFTGQVEEAVLQFLKVLAVQKRMKWFSGIVKEYCRLYNQAHGLLEMTAFTAVPMKPEMREKLKQKLEAVSGKKIALNCQVDPAVLGGVRLRYGNREIDHTIKTEMDQLKALIREMIV